jgi:hypothetical protein
MKDLDIRIIFTFKSVHMFVIYIDSDFKIDLEKQAIKLELNDG